MNKNENLDERLKSEEFKEVLEQNNKKYTNQLTEWYKTTYLCAFDDENKRKDNLIKLSLHMYSKASRKARYSYYQAFEMRKIAIHDALVDYYKVKNEVKSDEKIQEIFNDIMGSLPNVIVNYKLSKEDLEKYEATGYLKATDPTFSEKNVDLKKFARGEEDFYVEMDDKERALDELEMFREYEDDFDDYVEVKRDTGVGKRFMGVDEFDECEFDEFDMIDDVDENSGSSRSSK